MLERCVDRGRPDGGARRTHSAAATRSSSRRPRCSRAWDVLPYEGLSPDPRVSAHRLEALRLLAHGSGARVVVASARGVRAEAGSRARPTSSRCTSTSRGRSIATSSRARLVELGYEREDVAFEPGTFAVRGGVVDIFPAQDDRVARIELFGDDIESMRFVDPATQRSIGEATGVVVVARTELPPTPEIRRRAADAAERTGARPYLEEVTDKLERLASGAVPEGAESLLPRLWDAERTRSARSCRRAASSSLFDPQRASDEAARAVEQEEELASLWADPARLTDERRRTSRPRVRDEERGPAPAVRRRPRRHPCVAARRSGGCAAYATDPSTPIVDVHAWETASPRALLERCRSCAARAIDIVFCALQREVGAVGTRLAEEGLDRIAVVASNLHGGFVVAAA